MKLIKSIVLFSCMSIFSAFGHAATTYSHSSIPTDNQNKKTAAAYNCEIDIHNDTKKVIDVYGTFDDGERLWFPVDVYGWAAVDLFYNNACHAWMYLDIVVRQTGYHVFTGYVPVNSLVTVAPRMANQLKAEVQAK